MMASGRMMSFTVEASSFVRTAESTAESGIEAGGMAWGDSRWSQSTNVGTRSGVTSAAWGHCTGHPPTRGVGTWENDTVQASWCSLMVSRSWVYSTGDTSTALAVSSTATAWKSQPCSRGVSASASLNHTRWQHSRNRMRTCVGRRELRQVPSSASSAPSDRARCGWWDFWGPTDAHGSAAAHAEPLRLSCELGTCPGPSRAIGPT
mmetsp:Transcript_26192/g.84266  ORF Transcript_26192/g.84266 Transcript_26192/m.84266 type:complete len:206 (+) Transcript_26192:1051-1668(+)